jgi:hypothetical protein
LFLFNITPRPATFHKIFGKQRQPLKTTTQTKEQKYMKRLLLTALSLLGLALAPCDAKQRGRSAPQLDPDRSIKDLFIVEKLNPAWESRRAFWNKAKLEHPQLTKKLVGKYTGLGNQNPDLIQAYKAIKTATQQAPQAPAASEKPSLPEEKKTPATKPEAPAAPTAPVKPAAPTITEPTSSIAQTSVAKPAGLVLKGVNFEAPELVKIIHDLNDEWKKFSKLKLRDIMKGDEWNKEVLHMKNRAALTNFLMTNNAVDTTLNLLNEMTDPSLSWSEVEKQEASKALVAAKAAQYPNADKQLAEMKRLADLAIATRKLEEEECETYLADEEAAAIAQAKAKQEQAERDAAAKKAKWDAEAARVKNNQEARDKETDTESALDSMLPLIKNIGLWVLLLLLILCVIIFVVWGVRKLGTSRKKVKQSSFSSSPINTDLKKLEREERSVSFKIAILERKEQLRVWWTTKSPIAKFRAFAKAREEKKRLAVDAKAEADQAIHEAAKATAKSTAPTPAPAPQAPVRTAPQNFESIEASVVRSHATIESLVLFFLKTKKSEFKGKAFPTEDGKFMPIITIQTTLGSIQKAITTFKGTLKVNEQEMYISDMGRNFLQLPKGLLKGGDFSIRQWAYEKAQEAIEVEIPVPEGCVPVPVPVKASVAEPPQVKAPAAEPAPV